MKITCEACGANYSVADEKVRGKRVKIKCRNCAAAIVVDGRQLSATDEEPIEEEDATRVMDRDHGFHEAMAAVAPAPAAPTRPAAAPPPAANLVWEVNLSETDQRTLTTDQIVEGWVNGEVTEEAFVWRDGMDDWIAVLDVPALREAIDAASTQVGSSGAGAPPPAQPSDPVYELRGAQAPAVAPAAGRRAPTPAHGAPRPAAGAAAPTPARYAAKSTLLGMPPSSRSPATPAAFAAPTRPASVPPPPPAYQHPTPAFVPPAAPAPPMAVARAAARPREERAPGAVDLFGVPPSAPSHDDRPGVGARNENSVLFSLDALRGGAPKAAAPAPARRAPDAVDLMAMGGGGGSLGLGANDALLMAPPPMMAAPVAPQVAAAQPMAPRSPAGSVSAEDNPFASKRAGTVRALLMVVGALALMGGGGAAVFLYMKKTAPTEIGVLAQAPPTPPPTAPEPRATPEPPKAEAPPPVAPPVAEPPKADEPKKDEAKKDEPKEAKKEKQRGEPAEAPTKAEPKKTEEPVKLTDEADEPKAKKEEPAEEPKKEEPKKEEPSGEGGPFNKDAAKATLAAAATGAAACKSADGPTGDGKVQVTFAPSGRVTSANVTGGNFGGSSVGGCIAKRFRQAQVPPFSGDPVTVSKSFHIPE